MTKVACFQLHHLLLFDTSAAGVEQSGANYCATYALEHIANLCSATDPAHMVFTGRAATSLLITLACCFCSVCVNSRTTRLLRVSVHSQSRRGSLDLQAVQSLVPIPRRYFQIPILMFSSNRCGCMTVSTISWDDLNNEFSRQRWRSVLTAMEGSLSFFNIITLLRVSHSLLGPIVHRSATAHSTLTPLHLSQPAVHSPAHSSLLSRAD